MRCWYSRSNNYEVTGRLIPIHFAVSSPAPFPASKALEEKLAKLGITDELDLVMHLPLRYEDETHLYQIGDVPAGKIVQIEGVISRSEIVYRPRRQLVCQVEDDSG